MPNVLGANHRLRKTVARLFFGVTSALGLCTSTWAQKTTIQGVVVDAQDQSAVPFAFVMMEGAKNGVIADLDGKFKLEVQSPQSRLVVSCVGYIKQTVLASEASVVRLQRNTEVLNEMLVTPGLNPALRLIRSAEKNRKKNNPLGLNSFRYQSYNKLLLTFNADSIPLLDSLGQPDSSAIEARKFRDRSHLFLMESITERRYIQGSRDNERVVASRISGLQRADFALIGTQLQSLSFYPDELEILFVRFVNPIGPEASKHYWYQIRDSLIGTITRESEPGSPAQTVADTVYGIEFGPADPLRKDLMKGILYIGSADWSLRNVKAEFLDTSGFNIRIQQRYERFGNQWFTTQLLTDLSLSSLVINGQPLVGIGRTYLSEILINEPLNKKEIPRVDLSLDRERNEKDDAFWAQYRPTPLDSIEQGTYQFIDSVGQELKFDQWVTFGQALLDEKIRVGSLDFDLDRILRVNVFEVARLGLGVQTNRQFSPLWTLGGFAGYGFGDKAWKAGLDARFSPRPNGRLSFGVGWKQEIEETGAARYALERRRGLFDWTNSTYSVELYDRVQRWKTDVSWEVLPNLNTRISGAWEVRVNTFDRTINPPENPVELRSTLYTLSFDLNWAPHDRFSEGPYGRKRIRKAYPVWDLSVSYATPDREAPLQALESEVLTVWGRYQRQWKNLRWGDSKLQLEAGAVDFAQAPYGFLLSPNSNFRASNRESFGVAIPLSFETMVNNEFMLERLVQFNFRHEAPARWTRMRNWRPRLAFTQGMGWGWLNRAQDYEGVFQSMEHGFFESGLELNALFQGMGIGVYYRYGAYTRPEAIDNWAFKLSFVSPF
ncbi:hypothetical protein GC167_06365 [bacterium]|nr:hypothetical protein [bacterium]